VVLQSLGRWVQTAIRAHDIAGRYGGEEFAVLLPETPHAGAAILAERLRRMVEATPVYFEGREIRTTVSIGVAELQPDEPLAGLMMRADKAHYEAKHAGRNRVSF
jgi:diguanylate cyclase (GGDEF)-like protein